MNTRPLEIISDMNVAESETEILVRNGFSQDEIISLLWLQQWYQHGGSDRIEVLRNFEFLRLLVVNGKVDL